MVRKAFYKPSDVWGAAQAFTELWVSTPLVIALRTQQWWLSAPTDKRQQAENARMVTEKFAALAEVGFVWQSAALAWWLGTLNPWRSGRQMLDPLRRRTTSNVKRLRQVKRRNR